MVVSSQKRAKNTFSNPRARKSFVSGGSRGSGGSWGSSGGSGGGGWRPDLWGHGILIATIASKKILPRTQSAVGGTPQATKIHNHLVHYSKTSANLWGNQRRCRLKVSERSERANEQSSEWVSEQTSSRASEWASKRAVEPVSELANEQSSSCDDAFSK